MPTISSQQNIIFSDLKKLLSSKGIHKQGRFLLWGQKFVEEILHDSPSVAQGVVLGPSHEEFSGISSIRLSQNLFSELDVFGTRTPILICQAPFLSMTSAPAPAPKGLELVVAVSEPSNLGTIIRSAVSFGVERVILLKEAASPFHPRSVRASAGQVLKLSYSLGPSIENLPVEILRNCLALDMDGENLSGFKWPKDAFLLVGEEGRGLPKDIQCQKIRIKTEDKVESLNAATAISIAMFTYYSR